MKKCTWPYLIAIVPLFHSCSKQVKERQIETEVQTYNSNIKTCDCIGSGKDNDYRIEATINGEKLCFDRNQRPILPDVWAITPWDSSIAAGRYNADSTLLISIQYNNPHFQKQSFPYRVDSSNVRFCETVYITLLNLNPYKFCEGCIADDSYYTALSSTSNLSVSVLSFKDSVIEGSFEGDFNNRSPAKFKVTNGYFKTRLERRP